MPHETPSSTEREPKILVVDDSSVFCDLVKRFLHRAGFRQVVETHLVSEALAVLAEDTGRGLAAAAADEQTTGTFDLMLMDVDLPDLNGIEACRRLKAEDRFRDVPVLVVTAHTDSHLLAEAFAAGAIDGGNSPLTGYRGLGSKALTAGRTRIEQILEDPLLLGRQVEELHSHLDASVVHPALMDDPRGRAHDPALDRDRQLQRRAQAERLITKETAAAKAQ